MIALIMIGAVVLLLLLLLMVPVTADVSYRDGKFDARLRYVVMRYAMLPGGPEKPKKTKKAKKKKPEEEEKKSGGTMKTIEMVWSILKSSRRGLDILRRHLILSRVKVHIVVGGDDAASIAKTYGSICSAILAALDILGVLFVLREPTLRVHPDFLAGESKYEASMRISIRPLFLLSAGVSVLYKFMRILQQNKKAKNQTTNQQIKGGRTA